MTALTNSVQSKQALTILPAKDCILHYIEVILRVNWILGTYSPINTFLSPDS